MYMDLRLVLEGVHPLGLDLRNMMCVGIGWEIVAGSMFMFIGRDCWFWREYLFLLLSLLSRARTGCGSEYKTA